MSRTREARSPEQVEAINKAHIIARMVGGEDHLKTQAKLLSSQLAAMATLPEQLYVRESQGMQTYSITRISSRGSYRRSVKVADLKRVYPLAYQAAVTVSKPEKPYQVRMEAEFTRTAAREWAEQREIGATAQTDILSRRYGTLSWGPGTIARALFEIRADAKRLAESIDKAKDELVLWVTDHSLPLNIRGDGDGRLVLRENGMVTRVDYDVLEEQFPAAMTLVKRTSIPGSTQIRFNKIADDPDETDQPCD